ncbi:hypothetical protein D9M72_625690 [compost metagenome]
MPPTISSPSLRTEMAKRLYLALPAFSRLKALRPLKTALAVFVTLFSSTKRSACAPSASAMAQAVASNTMLAALSLSSIPKARW